MTMVSFILTPWFVESAPLLFYHSIVWFYSFYAFSLDKFCNQHTFTLTHSEMERERMPFKNISMKFHILGNTLSIYISFDLTNECIVTFNIGFEKTVSEEKRLNALIHFKMYRHVWQFINKIMWDSNSIINSNEYNSANLFSTSKCFKCTLYNTIMYELNIACRPLVIQTICTTIVAFV